MSNTTASPSQQPVAIEITVVSAQGLRPEEADVCRAVYTTRVDDRGGTDPWWNEKFRIPMETSFFADARSSVCVRLYSRGFARRGSLLGWCRIPAEDILLSSPRGKVGHLSYRLRDPRDGTRGHGIVNLAVKLDGLSVTAGSSGFTGPYSTETVIGILVRLPLPMGKFDRRCLWLGVQSH